MQEKLLDNKRVRTGILVSVSLLCLVVAFAVGSSRMVSPVHATINESMNLQGKLVNSDGTNITDGSYFFEVGIYTMATGGAASSSAQYKYSGTINTPNNTQITYTGDTDEGTIDPGMALYNTTDGDYAIVESIDTGTNTITLDRDIDSAPYGWAGSESITTRVQISDGIFNLKIVDLGSLDFDTDGLYVQIAFDSTPGGGDSINETFSPRKRLNAVPYAFRAKYADVSGDNYWRLSSNVVNPIDATYDFAIGGTTMAASMFGIDEDTGNFYFGYDNSVSPTFLFEASDGDAGTLGFNTNDAFYFSDANVGVGETNPLAKLHVNGGIGSLSTGIALGDGDTGIYESADDEVTLHIAGADEIVVDSISINPSTNKGMSLGSAGYSSSINAEDADTVVNGTTDDDFLGWSVSSAGDVNGDGYLDVIMGARKADDIGGACAGDCGRAYITYGSSSLSSSIDAENADVILNGETSSDYFGDSVSSAGDVNGDGYADVIVGAFWAEDTGSTRGQAFIFYGSNSLSSSINAEDADVVMNGENDTDQFGKSVSSAGDVNGDGYGDVIVGADSDGGGSAYLFYGSDSLSSSIDAENADVRLASADSGDQFGISVSSAGDVNGDGYSDMIVGADQAEEVFEYAEGRVFIFYGSSSLPSLIYATSADVIINGEDQSDNLGISVSSAGDINGDGFADIIAGAWQAEEGATSSDDHGRVYILYGSDSLSSPIDAENVDVIITGTAIDDNLGWSVSSAGDVNGDGFADIIAGAKYAEDTGSLRGRVYILYGSDSLSSSIDAEDIDVIINGTDDSDIFGYSVSSAGDVDGDGHMDVIVGAPVAEDAGSDRGQVYLFSPTVSEFQSIYAESLKAGLAIEVGDLTLTNNDLITQSIFGIATPNWSISRQGSAAFQNLTVSGDTTFFGDLLPGADDTYDLGSDSLRWRDIYLGSESIHIGTSISDEYTISYNTTSNYLGFNVNGDGDPEIIFDADGDVGIGVTTALAKLHVNGGTGSLSTGVALGDGDTGLYESADDEVTVAIGGGDELVIDSTGIDPSTNKGMSLGSAGFSSSIDAENADTVVNGTTDGDAFGDAVSDAGDVNGDGYGDMIVGARNAEDTGSGRGLAYLFYGSSSLSSSIDAENADVTFNGTTDGDGFGWSVSSAGDVNGDGYMDVIVGAKEAEDTGDGQGRAYLFYGSSSLSSSIDAENADVIMNGTVNGDNFGYDLSAAGDVNGDGYGDFIVGAWTGFISGTSKGRAYLFYGSDSLSSSIDVEYADVIIDGTSEGDRFGTSVSGGGDIDGDGYSDVVIGANSATDTGTDRGRAYIIYGSSSLSSSIAAASSDVIINGTADSDEFGISVSDAGDINADGFADVIVGCYEGAGTDSGRAYIILGSDSLSSSINAESADMIMNGETGEDFFGFRVSHAGDVNGDGYGDIIVGAYQATPIDSDGKAYIMLGSASLPSSVDAEDADIIMNGTNGADFFGFSVSHAGDVDGDGYSDIIVGAPSAEDTGSGRGRAYLFSPTVAEFMNIYAETLKAGLAIEVGDLFLSNTDLIAESIFRISAPNWSISGQGSAAFQGLTVGGDAFVGGTSLTASMFGIDESAGNFYFGYDNSVSPTLLFEASDGDAGSLAFNTNDAFYFANASVGIGISNPSDKLEVYGDLRINTAAGDGDEIYFTDNGQIRSSDDDHRIRFRRSENIFEIVEYGDIILNTTAGAIGIDVDPPNTDTSFWVNNLAGNDSYPGMRYRAATGAVYTSTSSIRYKENIEPLIDDFTKILNAQPMTYTMKNDGSRGYGYIAEEFIDIGLDVLVFLDEETGLPETIFYEKIPIYNLEMIKMHHSQLGTFESRIGSVTVDLSGQESRIDGLRSSMSSVEADLDAILNNPRVTGNIDVGGSVEFDSGGDATTNALCYSGARNEAALADRELVPCSTAQGDIAQWYDVANAEAGDIVVITEQTITYPVPLVDAVTGIVLSTQEVVTASVLEKSAQDYQRNVIGVVSASPYEVFGSGAVGVSSNPNPVALVGSAQVKVSTSNGTIVPGDPIAASDMPGVGMKATSTGVIIGKALEPYDNESEVGLINVAINVSWYEPEDVVADMLMMLSDYRNGDLGGSGGGGVVSGWAFDGSTISTSGDVIASTFTGTTGTFSILRTQTIDIGGGNFYVDSNGNVDIAGDLVLAGVISGRYGDLTIKLGDSEGENKFSLVNSEDEEVFSVDSTGKITASDLSLTQDEEVPENTSIGMGMITEGEKLVTVSTSRVRPDSQIILTFAGNYSPATRYWYGNIEEGVGFDVVLDQETSRDVDFTWWIVNSPEEESGA